MLRIELKRAAAGPLVAGAGAAAVDEAPTGRVLASLPSERMVTVRIRLGHRRGGRAVRRRNRAGGVVRRGRRRGCREAGDGSGVSGAAALGGTDGRRGRHIQNDRLLLARHDALGGAASPTRSWIALLDCASVAGTILVGVLSATIIGAAAGAPNWNDSSDSHRRPRCRSWRRR